MYGKIKFLRSDILKMTSVSPSFRFITFSETGTENVQFTKV